MEVVARVAAYPDREFKGKVSAINPSVDPNSRVFILEARFDNPDNALRPGMFATARVLLPGGEDAVFVPRTAVVRDKTTDSTRFTWCTTGRPGCAWCWWEKRRATRSEFNPAWPATNGS